MKKFILLFFFLTVFASIIQAQDNRDFNPNAVKSPATDNGPVSLTTAATWSSLATSPHAVSRSCCTFIRRAGVNYLYQFGGGATTQLTNVAVLNINTNTWTNSVSTMPFAISAGTSIADGDSIIYVIGGNTGTFGKIMKYNIGANTWTTLTDMPLPVTDAVCVKYQDTLIYVIGGGDGTFGAVVSNGSRLFRMRSGTWATLSNFPISVAMMGGGIYKDTIIMTGGWTGAAPGNATTYKGVINPSDPTQITWTTLANYPTGGVTRMASYVCSIPGQGVGIVFSGGAVDGATLTAATNFWNFCTRTWQSLPANGLARSNLKGSGNGDSLFYIVGGFTTVGVGNCEKLSFSQIDGSCASGPPPPPIGNTLVLIHDSTITSTVPRKADRDTLNVYLRSLVGNYTIMNFVAATTLPDLSGYNTIILQETSFDVSGTIFLGPAARTSIKNWLSSGTPSSKKSLISIGADQAYNYSRSGSSAQDLEFADTYGKFVYRVDNAPGTTSPSITGIATDIGNTRPLTSSPAGGAYWPDGCSMSAGGTALYKYQNHTAVDTLAAIGNVTANYVVATLFQDPRYFTGGFGNVLAATINWVVANGGVITGVNNNHVSTIADNYMLAQNYPNPFNPSTKINYTIPKSGLVSIKVFDMLGREVSTLVNEVKNAGTFEVTFDGSNYSSGTYFYRIETADFVQTKKMSLLK